MVAFAGDLFLPLTAKAFLSLLLVFSAYLAGFVTLPFRDVGVSFEEPHFRLLF